MLTDAGYRCMRGAECPDYREGTNHAHGQITGQPELLALNHRLDCDRVIEGRDKCACGAAIWL